MVGRLPAPTGNRSWGRTSVGPLAVGGGPELVDRMLTGATLRAARNGDRGSAG